MNIRKIILLASTAFLLLVLGLQFGLRRGEGIRTVGVKGDIDSILIAKNEGEWGGASELRLERSAEGHWSIMPEGYPVEAELMNTVLAAFTHLKVLGTVSRGANRGRYELGPESRILATAYAGDNELRRLSIGKAASASQQTYVALDDKKEVFLVAGNLRREFEKNTEDMRSRQIYEARANDFNQVSVQGQYNWEIQLEGSPLRWKRVDTEADLNQEAVNNWLNGLASLRAIGFPAANVQLDRADILSRVYLDGLEKRIEINIGPKGEDERYLCTSSESQWPFQLSAYMAERFIKDPVDFEK